MLCVLLSGVAGVCRRLYNYFRKSGRATSGPLFLRQLLLEGGVSHLSAAWLLVMPFCRVLQLLSVPQPRAQQEATTRITRSAASVFSKGCRFLLGNCREEYSFIIDYRLWYVLSMPLFPSRGSCSKIQASIAHSSCERPLNNRCRSNDNLMMPSLYFHFDYFDMQA